MPELWTLGVVSPHESFDTEMVWSGTYRSFALFRMACHNAGCFPEDFGVHDDVFIRSYHGDFIGLYDSLAALASAYLACCHFRRIGVIDLAKT